MPRIVQFFHPQVEAIPEDENSGMVDWNNSETHKRKFIKNTGKYINIGDTIKSGELTFWGEWEPQSKVEKLDISARTPKYIHTPYLSLSGRNMTHNTDPYVFGSCFRYMICQQKAFHNILKNLEPNSIILFGSCINNLFCLDTLFVVSKHIISYNTDNFGTIFPKKDQFFYASVNPLLGDILFNQNLVDSESCRIKDGEQYTYYEAVKYEERECYNGMFSYVPSRVFTNNNSSTFVQPAINLDFFSTGQNQGINSKECNLSELKNYWLNILEQIRKKGLNLGVSFDSPKIKV